MKKYYTILLAALAALTTTSCSGWFDVIPRSSVYEEDLYKNEIGYQQVLTGLYQKMGSSSLYGGETSFGLVDVVSGQYYIPQTLNKTYLYATQYNYEYASTKSAITGIWNDAYNAIANANELLRNAGVKQDVAPETAGYQPSSAFNSEQTRAILTGEALAVRAYLHFDLVRLFGMSPAVNGNKPAIPYVTTLKKELTPQSTVNEVLQKVITDLLQAASLLETTDPIVKGNPLPADDYFARINRPTHLNYYAVCGLLARVYQYAGQEKEAGVWAQKVIDANAFKWNSVTALNNKDYVGTSELLFNLFIRDMETSIIPYFRYDTSGSNSYLLPISEQNYKDLYQTGDRRAKAFQLYQGAYLCQKYVVSSGTAAADTATVQNRIPMVRLSEVYYIAAESAMDAGDITSAAKDLNTVRKNRGLSAKAMTTADAIRQELDNEYKREFVAEGQLFYYIKRINQPGLIDTQFSVDFVFPIPDNEYTYGNRQKNK